MMTSSLRSRNISKLHSLIVLLMTSLIGGGEGAWQDGIQPLIRVSQLGSGYDPPKVGDMETQKPNETSLL
ncbi:hypothetical protein TNCV_4653921 [Trichonephila clavipes]|nr:hypothetical protein TNCV_4653921 [Trichonephila clavipes]